MHQVVRYAHWDRAKCARPLMQTLTRNNEEIFMSACCSTSCSSNQVPKRHICPANGIAYGQVPSLTIKHQIKSPWSWSPTDQGYYFCTDPDCPIVYFGEDDSTIEKTELRSEIGFKSKSEQAIVCYCFGVTKSQAKADPDIRDFVIQETKQHQCACEARNPSGKCCLSEFPK